MDYSAIESFDLQQRLPYSIVGKKDLFNTWYWVQWWPLSTPPTSYKNSIPDGSHTYVKSTINSPTENRKLSSSRPWSKQQFLK